MSRARSYPLLQSVTRNLGLIALLVAWAFFHSALNKPRAWTAAQTPVAFWAWRDQAPATADVSNVVNRLRARTIFVRAGQIDSENGKILRIRAVTGSLPRGVGVHLVYNGTRQLLAQLEQIDEGQLAAAISTAYAADVLRSEQEQVRIVGLQVDLDTPTRLLGKYERTLKLLRGQLKSGTQLSITGLPTWMQSPELRSTLAAVDFWIPQLYGLELPEQLTQSIPISSPANILRFVAEARELDKPFYAGLAAFSWTLLYSKSGDLISLRGDMDPGLIAADANLELIEQRQFAEATGEWRYSYRARADGVTDQLVMHAGEVLVVDLPSSRSLRMATRAVREGAGPRLLGICVFRLPAADDLATLSLEQVASALSDIDSFAQVETRMLRDSTNSARSSTSSLDYIVEVKNVGTESSTVGTAKIDFQLTPGTVENLVTTDSVSVDWLCGAMTGTDSNILQPCSERRASVLRIKPRILAAGQNLKLRLTLNTEPEKVPVWIEMETNSGQTYRVQRVMPIQGR